MSKPKFHLHMWAGQTTPCFQQVTEHEFRELSQHSDDTLIYRFNGQNCDVDVVVTKHPYTRQEALKVAVDFVTGFYIRTEVDLDKLTWSETKGEPIIHPPN